jgi:hypothetical protein
VAARKDLIKTLAAAGGMIEEFRKTTLDDEGSDGLEKCKKFTRPMVELGGNQDELAGECRWVVKMLRQRAGILMAVDPKVAVVAEEIRAMTREMLRNPAHHESAHH